MADRTAVPPPLEFLEIDLDPPAAVAAPPPPAEPRSQVATVAAAILLAGALLAAWLVLRPGPPADRPPLPPPGAEGLAELFVTLYLTTDDPRRQFDIAGLSPLGIHADTGPNHRFVNQAFTVDIVPTAGDGSPGTDDDPVEGPADGPVVWVATVAADVLVANGPDAPHRSDGIHHYRVSMVETGRGLAFTGLPVRSGPPPPRGVPPRKSDAATEDDALWTLVEGFLAAYLTGATDLHDHITGDSAISAVYPAPYRAVTVDVVTVAALVDDRIHLRVVGTADDGAGSPLLIEHHLIARSQDGSWRIESVAAGPPLQDALAETSTTLTSPVGSTPDGSTPDGSTPLGSPSVG